VVISLVVNPAKSTIATAFADIPLLPAFNTYLFIKSAVWNLLFDHPATCAYLVPKFPSFFFAQFFEAMYTFDLGACSTS
jgi:hypothetical protein